MPEPRQEPDWGKLAEISRRAEEQSRQPGWNRARWEALYQEAAVACHGHGEYTEFMAAYLPENR